jgi:hypothetical protein
MSQAPPILDRKTVQKCPITFEEREICKNSSDNGNLCLWTRGFSETTIKEPRGTVWLTIKTHAHFLPGAKSCITWKEVLECISPSF